VFKERSGKKLKKKLKKKAAAFKGFDAVVAVFKERSGKKLKKN